MAQRLRATRIAAGSVIALAMLMAPVGVASAAPCAGGGGADPGDSPTPLAFCPGNSATTPGADKGAKKGWDNLGPGAVNEHRTDTPAGRDRQGHAGGDGETRCQDLILVTARLDDVGRVIGVVRDLDFVVDRRVLLRPPR